MPKSEKKTTYKYLLWFSSPPDRYHPGKDHIGIFESESQLLNWLSKNCTVLGFKDLTDARNYAKIETIKDYTGEVYAPADGSAKRKQKKS